AMPTRPFFFSWQPCSQNAEVDDGPGGRRAASYRRRGRGAWDGTARPGRPADGDRRNNGTAERRIWPIGGSGSSVMEGGIQLSGVSAELDRGDVERQEDRDRHQEQRDRVHFIASGSVG